MNAEKTNFYDDDDDNDDDYDDDNNGVRMSENVNACLN